MKTFYCLIGMKHSGKTTVGKIIANRLKLRFFDLDSYTEAAYTLDRIGAGELNPGKRLTCREIYRRFGKEQFMEYEAAGAAEILKEAAETGGVCALGGGSIENPGVMRAFEGNALFIYIDEKEEILFERIERSGIPPFLAGPDPGREFHTLFKKRTRLYKRRADLWIEAAGEDPEKIASRIMQEIQGREMHRWAKEHNHGRE
jgi:shikimate kinase